MDFAPNEVQQQILDSVDKILDRTTDWHRTLELLEAAAYDTKLHTELQQAGFLDLPLSEGTGSLEAAFVVERVAERPANVATSATGLVYPMVTGTPAPGPVALSGAVGAPFRMAPFASTVLILDGDCAKQLHVSATDILVVDNHHYGWGMGRLTSAALARAEPLGPGSGQLLKNWWRVGLALEAAGAMRGAIADTSQYCKERIQFGRPIGAFQAIQHRLAHLVVLTEGVYWLALEAAYDCNDISACTAATHATVCARSIVRETHQMHGAIGLTREYPLHLWTLRLPALQREMGGLINHSRSLAKAIAG